MAPQTRQPRCHRCGEPLARVIAPPYVEKMKYDGGRHDVLVEGMPQWRCNPCGETMTDDDSDVVVQDCLRRHIGLLTAAEIRSARTALGLTQTDLAGLLGCAAESVSRWENAAVLQSRTYDRLLRLVFQLPAVRQLLGVMGQDCLIGRQAVAGADTPSASVVETMKALTRIWEGAAPCAAPDQKPGVTDRARARSQAMRRALLATRANHEAAARHWAASSTRRASSGPAPQAEQS
jgi:putative zinc finger/helix-turn-helix YgiT family protein